jgi:hypothetical protein
MSPSAEWEATYRPIPRDHLVAMRVLKAVALAPSAPTADEFAALRETIAREIGIAIARAVELELVP